MLNLVAQVTCKCYCTFMANEWKANAGRLKEWREKDGRSQDAVARAVGATQKAVDDWEDGRKVPGLDFIMALERLTDGAVPAVGWVGRIRKKPEPRSEPRMTKGRSKRAAVGT